MGWRIHNPAAFFAVVNATASACQLDARALAEIEHRNRWNDFRNALTRDGYSWDEAHAMTVAHFAAIDHQSADEAADAQQE